VQLLRSCRSLSGWAAHSWQQRNVAIPGCIMFCALLLLHAQTSDHITAYLQALDQDSLSALVQSICSTTGAWDPKPVAKKVRVRGLSHFIKNNPVRLKSQHTWLYPVCGLLQECIRVLAQLPLPSCPVADIVLQQHLPKVLVYLKKTLQVRSRMCCRCCLLDCLSTACHVFEQHVTAELCTAGH